MYQYHWSLTTCCYIAVVYCHLQLFCCFMVYNHVLRFFKMYNISRRSLLNNLSLPGPLLLDFCSVLSRKIDISLLSTTDGWLSSVVHPYVLYRPRWHVASPPAWPEKLLLMDKRPHGTSAIAMPPIHNSRNRWHLIWLETFLHFTPRSPTWNKPPSPTRSRCKGECVHLWRSPQKCWHSPTSNSLIRQCTVSRPLLRGVWKVVGSQTRAAIYFRCRKVQLQPWNNERTAEERSRVAAQRQCRTDGASVFKCDHKLWVLM